MNKMFLMLLVTMTSFKVYAQCDLQITAQKMTDLMAFYGEDKQAIIARMDDDKPGIQYHEFIIPVTKSVILRTEMNSSKTIVVFYFQDGVAVTSSKDNSWRRAHYVLTFPDKKSAKKFIELYKACASK